MSVCEAVEERSLAELSTGDMRKQRLHDAQIRHLRTSVFFIVDGVRLVPYATIVTGQISK
ncbi:hypothetical protein N7468_002869 [Penicillium chermesinum]|uniref:Uncharacterized protein n=1 Tax=Penicillium chermesinum TaxID=63820 RepID=A0A9W9PL03_9EURO|nr:uncharacterized protein N7468_002869 [Penicillium chermesinum]KAJ5247886.1 hypothetical protein N7468_002869 [Penicillium chermesinum]